MADIIMQGTARGLESRSQGIRMGAAGIAKGLGEMYKNQRETEEKALRVNNLTHQNRKLNRENIQAEKDIVRQDNYTSVINKNLPIPETVDALMDSNLTEMIPQYLEKTNNVLKDESQVSRQKSLAFNERLNVISRVATSTAAGTPEEADRGWAEIEGMSLELDPNTDPNGGMGGLTSAQKIERVASMSEKVKKGLDLANSKKIKDIFGAETAAKVYIQKMDPNDPNKEILIDSYKTMRTSRLNKEADKAYETEMTKMKVDSKQIARGRVHSFRAFNLELDADRQGDIAQLDMETQALMDANIPEDKVYKLLKDIYTFAEASDNFFTSDDPATFTRKQGAPTTEQIIGAWNKEKPSANTKKKAKRSTPEGVTRTIKDNKTGEYIKQERRNGKWESI